MLREDTKHLFFKVFLYESGGSEIFVTCPLWNIFFLLPPWVFFTTPSLTQTSPVEGCDQIGRLRWQSCWWWRGSPAHKKSSLSCWYLRALAINIQAFFIPQSDEKQGKHSSSRKGMSKMARTYFLGAFGQSPSPFMVILLFFPRQYFPSPKRIT